MNLSIIIIFLVMKLVLFSILGKQREKLYKEPIMEFIRKNLKFKTNIWLLGILFICLDVGLIVSGYLISGAISFGMSLGFISVWRDKL